MAPSTRPPAAPGKTPDAAQAEPLHPGDIPSSPETDPLKRAWQAERTGTKAEIAKQMDEKNQEVVTATVMPQTVKKYTGKSAGREAFEATARVEGPGVLENVRAMVKENREKHFPPEFRKRVTGKLKKVMQDGKEVQTPDGKPVFEGLTDEAAGGTLTEILNALIAEPPKSYAIAKIGKEKLIGEKPVGDVARYLKSSQKSSRLTDVPSVTIYEVKASQIQTDIKTVEAIKAPNPHLATEMDLILTRLKAYLQADFKERVEAIYGVPSQGIRTMGRISAILALAAMGLFTGIIALTNKKWSLAPFLYIGLAVFLADPSLFRKMFSKKDQVQIEALARLTEKRISGICERFEIKGPGWPKAIGEIARDEKRTRNVIDIVEKGQTSDKDKETIESFLKSLSDKPDDPVRKTVERMMGTRILRKPDGQEQEVAQGVKTQFTFFAEAILQAKKEGPLNGVSNYIALGVWQRARQMPTQKELDQFTAAMESTPPDGTETAKA